MDNSPGIERTAGVGASALTLSLLVPLHNEADAVGPLLDRLSKVLGARRDLRLEAIFINDGSTDGTLEKLLLLRREHPFIRIVDLSRNFGKEAALTAGLKIATGDVVVPIDADLQDPPELIPQMIEKWREGYEVVLARRIDRSADGWLKRKTAQWFYRIHNLLSDSALPENVGDFRLMDRAVVEALNELPESKRFMKGLFAWVGFRTAVIDYVRAARTAGTSKFNGWRLWNFALEGITSFSTSPLRIWTYLGSAIALLSFAFGLLIVLRVLAYGIDVPGYASLAVAVTFLGGLQLMGIGVIGEYLGRTYLETKRRPPYIIRQVYGPEP